MEGGDLGSVTLGAKKHQVYGVLELAKVAKVETYRYFTSRFVSGYPVLFKTTIAFNYHQNHNFSSANFYQDFITDSSSFEPHTLQGTGTYPTLGSSENHRLKIPFVGGYVSSLEGIHQYHQG